MDVVSCPHPPFLWKQFFRQLPLAEAFGVILEGLITFIAWAISLKLKEINMHRKDVNPDPFLGLQNTLCEGNVEI